MEEEWPGADVSPTGAPSTNSHVSRRGLLTAAAFAVGASACQSSAPSESSLEEGVEDGAVAPADVVEDVSRLDTEGPLTPSPGPSAPASRTDAVRFLNQATFGASKPTIDELMGLDYSTWIDQQLALEPSLTEPFLVADGRGSLQTLRHYVWWTNAVEGEDQLRQRLAFAWSEIFVVSDNDYTLSNAQFAMCHFYDMLAVGSTGNFRDLLEQVTLHPVMGIYLSMVRNERADPERSIRPDENFARELMQLFTTGLHELTPDGRVVIENGEPVPAYDQSTVEEFAKLWTGWNFADADEWVSNDMTPYDKRLTMVAWEEFHETEEKRLLNGTVVPSGQTSAVDMSAALDNVFVHPNVGPFISRLLIQRLVTSNPTPSYVGRIAAVFDDDGTGERGNLAAVTKALLLDSEARLGHETMPERFGKFKEPIMRLAQLWRAFNVTAGPESEIGYRPYARPVDQLGQVLGQAVMRAPSVFNFFRPDNPLGPDSDLVAPELSILSEVNVASTNNMLFQQIYFNNHLDEEQPNISRIDLSEEVDMAADPATLVAHLNELLVAGTLPVELTQSIIEQLAAHPSDPDGRLARATDAVYAIVGSPFHLVQA